MKQLVNIKFGSNSTFAYLTQNEIEKALAKDWIIQGYINHDQIKIVVLCKGSSV